MFCNTELGRARARQHFHQVRFKSKFAVAKIMAMPWDCVSQPACVDVLHEKIHTVKEMLSETIDLLQKDFPDPAVQEFLRLVEVIFEEVTTIEDVACMHGRALYLQRTSPASEPLLKEVKKFLRDLAVLYSALQANSDEWGKCKARLFVTWKFDPLLEPELESQIKNSHSKIFGQSRKNKRFRKKRASALLNDTTAIVVDTSGESMCNVD